MVDVLAGRGDDRLMQYSKKKIIIFALLTGCITLICLSSVPVFSDQIYTIESQGSSFPVYDSVNYRVQETIPGERTDGRKFFVSRPFGYLECMEDTHANISVKKTYVDRVSRDKAYIRGEIKNLDDKTIDVIVLTFNLYNADGDQIGNAYATVDYLEPKKTWKFSTDPINRPDFKFERYGSIFVGVYS